MVVTYGLGGLLVTVVADWKRLLPAKASENVDAVSLLANYGGGFIVAMALVIVCYIAMIYVTSRGSGYPPFQAVLDFLFYGYGHFTGRLEQHRTSQQVQRAFTEATGKAAQYLAAIVLRTHRYLANPNDDARKDLYREILDAITTQCTPFLSGGSGYESNANYMLAVPIEKITQQQKDSTRFLSGPMDDLSHLLVLCDYAKEAGALDSFSLPVPKMVGDWEERVLPGAPEAFLRKKMVVVGGGSTPFGSGVPKKVREDITDFFKKQSYRCFVSLIVPLRVDGFPIGVVNVESNHDGIVRHPNREKVLVEMRDLLQPYCALLGLLLAYKKAS